MRIFDFFKGLNKGSEKRLAEERGEMRYTSRNHEKFLEYSFSFLEETFTKSTWQRNGETVLTFRDGIKQIMVDSDWDGFDIYMGKKGIHINILDCNELFDKMQLHELKLRTADKKVGERIVLFSKFLKENFDYSKWNEWSGDHIGENRCLPTDQKNE